MSIDLSAILEILTNQSGDLIYHLVLGLSLILLIGLASRKLSRSASGRRAWHVWIGGMILLFLQIILFCLRFWRVQSTDEIPTICILIEHITNTFTILWLVWTFINPKQPFLFTCLEIVFTIALITSGTISIILLILQPGFMPISSAVLLNSWQFIGLLLTVSGLILILIKRDPQWVAGMFILILLAAGHVIQLIIKTDVPSFMGGVRLAQILSFPWLIVLARRFAPEKVPAAPKDAPLPVEDMTKPVDTKPALIDQLLKINTQETSEDKYKAIVQALSLSVVADICYLVELPKNAGAVHLIAGYDLIRERELAPVELRRDQFPYITTAWQENQPLQLFQAPPTKRDVATLIECINYHRIGNLLAFPLFLTNQSTPSGGVIFLSPYTDKRWEAETLHQMETIAETLAKVIFTPNIKEKLKASLTEAQDEILTLHQEKEKLILTLAEKEAMLNQLNMEIKKCKAKYQIDRFEQISQVDRMKERIRELTTQTAAQADLPHRLEQMDERIRQLSQERDHLKMALDQAEARIKYLESQAGQTGPIRLSMESQIISLDSIAANARLGIAQQIQQKEITLEIVNPDGRQMIKTDPELLENTIKGLLENAIRASRSGETIQLSQKLSFETGMLIMQVTDHGEGLTAADQKNLFSSNYDAISGIGSVQAIRNAVRAIRVLNGKVWLRSKKDAFTTFRVQLPVRIID